MLINRVVKLKVKPVMFRLTLLFLSSHFEDLGNEYNCELNFTSTPYMNNLCNERKIYLMHSDFTFTVISNVIFFVVFHGL